MEGSDRSPTPCLQKTFFANLHRQQQQDLFCDVVLYAEGEGIPVHRCILAAFSPFFLQRFSSHDAQSQRAPMELPGLKAATLKTLVRFMYTAEAPLPQDETKGFLQAARRFCILGFAGGLRSSPVAEPQGSLTPAGAVPRGECMLPLPQPQSHPKTPGSSGQGRTPGDDFARTVADCEPKAPAVPASSSPLLQRSRGKCANPPGNPPALSLVASWRRMKVCQPATANPPLCPRRPWRQKRGEPGGHQALPSSHRANAEGSRPPPHPSPSPAPGRRLCPLPKTPEYPRSAGVPTDVQPGPRLSDPSQERSGQGSVSQATRGEEEGGEAIERPAEGLAKNAGPLCTARGLAFGSAPASESEQTGTGLPPQERHPDQARREPTPIGSLQRRAAHPVPARDTRQAAVSQGLPRPEQRRRAVRGPTHQPGTWLGKEGSPPGIGAASEQAVPCPTAPPGTVGPSANPSKQGYVKGANVQRGKRSCCQDIPRDRLLGIKLQKLTHSREWVVIPMPENQELEPVPDPGTAGQCPGDGSQARTVAGPLVGSHSQTGGARQGLATPGRAGRRKALTNPAQSVAGSVESDQRPENLVGNHRAAGLGLGSDQSSGSLGPGAGPKSGDLGPERDQSPGGPGLGSEQRSGGAGLGSDQRSGGPGSDQRSGGPGLGSDQRSGGPGLGSDQRSGGPELGSDQRSGGPGSDQRSGGPGVGSDQRSGGPGLGSDQRSGGPGLGSDQRSGGPGLGSDQRSGGPGLESDQRSGGPGLGSDQRSGGPGSDQRSGGPGLGSDQRSGGPGLGSDQRSGGPGLGSDQRSGRPGLGSDQRSGGPGSDERSGGPGLGGDQRSGGPGSDERSGGPGLGGDQRSGGPGGDQRSGGPGSDQRSGGPGGDQRSGGPGLGSDQRSGRPGLGSDQRSGGPGSDERSGGPGLGGDQRSGGPGSDERSGGPGLGGDQRSGGPGGDQRSGGPGSDQRSGGPGGDQRSGGPGLGSDQRSGGPGLGSEQRSGGPGLGSDQRSGGPGVGSDQRSGGPGLGSDQRSGGPGLGSGQRSGGPGSDERLGGPGLGSDQRSGGPGLGSDQRSGGPGLGSDQRSGGPGLGSDQRSGGPGLGGDQRSGGPGGDQRSGGPGLGSDQRLGGPGLGSDQRSGGPGLGSDQRSGGPGLGSDQRSGGPGGDQRSGGPGSEQRSGGPGLGSEQRSGGPGLGSDQRSGGPGLGSDQRSGGPGLGGDQRSGGPGSDQRSGGPGLGSDQRLGGPGLGGDQRSGGPGDGRRPECLSLRNDQRSGDLKGHQGPGASALKGTMYPGQRGPISCPTPRPEQSRAVGTVMLPQEPRVQEAAEHPFLRPDHWGLALPRVTSQAGASPPTDEWGFGWLRVRGQVGVRATSDPWDAGLSRFMGQHRTDEQAAGSSSSDDEVDVGDGRETLLPLVTVWPDGSPPASPPLDYPEIDVVG